MPQAGTLYNKTIDTKENVMYTELKNAMKGKKEVSVTKSIVGTIVRHYQTNIFVAREGHVQISSGGMFSATTKRHINDCFRAIGMNASVYQRDYTWYVETNGIEQVFFDGMVVNW